MVGTSKDSGLGVRYPVIVSAKKLDGFVNAYKTEKHTIEIANKQIIARVLLNTIVFISSTLIFIFFPCEELVSNFSFRCFHHKLHLAPNQRGS